MEAWALNRPSVKLGMRQYTLRTKTILLCLQRRELRMYPVVECFLSRPERALCGLAPSRPRLSSPRKWSGRAGVLSRVGRALLTFHSSIDPFPTFSILGIIEKSAID